MKIKKGVLITHPITDYREIYMQHNRQSSYSSSSYTSPAPQKAILYHLKDGKFLFYFGKTNTANSISGQDNPQYHFRAKSNYDGSSLEFTLKEARIYSRQTLDQEKLLLAVKKDLEKRRRKSISEERVIEIGVRLTSEGENLEFYGTRDRRMVAKSLMVDLLYGEALSKKGLGSLVISNKS